MSEKLLNELHNLHSVNRFPATILLYGGFKSTTESIINSIALTLLCENKSFCGCGNCHSCTLFKAGNHPDFFAIDIEQNSKVEDLREALRMYSLKPYLKVSRVTIIQNADSLNLQSANLLLKTLEEPLNDSYFLLTANQTSRIPVTILSRCQKFFLGADQAESSVSSDFLQDFEMQILKQEDESIIGSIIENKEIWIGIRAALKQIASGDGAKIILFCRELTKSKETVELNSRLLMNAVRLEMLMCQDADLLARLATVLSNLISFEYLAFERNLTAAGTLSAALLPLADENFIVASKDENLLSEIVV